MEKNVKNFKNLVSDNVKFTNSNGRPYCYHNEGKDIVIEQDAVIEKGTIIDGNLYIRKGVDIIAEEGVVITGYLYYNPIESNLDLEDDVIIRGGFGEYNNNKVSIVKGWYSGGGNHYSHIDRFSKLFDNNATIEYNQAVFYRQKDGRLYVDMMCVDNDDCPYCRYFLEVLDYFNMSGKDLFTVKELGKNEVQYLAREFDGIASYKYMISSTAEGAINSLKYVLSLIEQLNVNNCCHNLVNRPMDNETIVKIMKYVCDLPIWEAEWFEHKLAKQNPNNEEVTIKDLLNNRLLFTREKSSSIYYRFTGKSL